MTQTQGETPAGGENASDDGPRVNRDQLHDLDRLRRSSTDRYVAGVAGGLGRHFAIDPVLIRVVLIVACFFGGAGLILYVAMWLLVPEDGDDHAPVRLAPEPRRIVLIVVAVLALAALLGNAWGGWGDGGWYIWRLAWPLGIAAVVIAFVLGRRRRSDGDSAYDARRDSEARAQSTFAPRPPAPARQEVAPRPPHPSPPQPPLPPRRPRRTGLVLFWPTLALIALAWGALGIFDIQHDVSFSHWPAVGLGVVGLMLVIGAFVGRPGGLILIGCLLVAALSVTAVLSGDGWPNRTRTHVPTSAAAVHDTYHMDSGRLVVDLSRVTDPEQLDGRTIYANTSVGEVEVVLPPGMAARVDAGLWAGDINVGNARHDGFRWTYDGRFGPRDADSVIDLVLRVRVGEIDVHHARSPLTASDPVATGPLALTALADGSLR